jgi:hypothetical protein
MARVNITHQVTTLTGWKNVSLEREGRGRAVLRLPAKEEHQGLAPGKRVDKSVTTRVERGIGHGDGRGRRGGHG